MKHSFRDPVTGVLKSHGFIEQGNDPTDIAQVEAEDFSLMPGTVRFDGDSWVPIDDELITQTAA